MCFGDQNIMQRRDPMEMNFGGLEMQKRNTPINRAQRVDENNGVMCVFIMLTPKVTVIKMSEIAHFLYFLLMTPKN